MSGRITRVRESIRFKADVFDGVAQQDFFFGPQVVQVGLNCYSQFAHSGPMRDQYINLSVEPHRFATRGITVSMFMLVALARLQRLQRQPFRQQRQPSWRGEYH